MPDGITLKRIIDMDETQQLSSSDYVLVDSQTGGNRKYKLGEKLPQMDEDLEKVKEDLEAKADKDGSYDDLTSGNAKQLVSTVFTDDSTPYLFRTTGGSADVGDREYVDAVVGGTVAWNQLVQNGDFEDSSNWAGAPSLSISDGVATYTATGRYDGLYQVFPVMHPKDHVYFMHTKLKTSTATDQMQFILQGQGTACSKYSASTTEWQTVESIEKSTLEFDRVTVRDNRADIHDSYQVADIYVMDLTQKFGTQIADYVYSLEQANAGAGVAWFKKLFPNMDAEYSDNGVTKKLRDYQAGTLISVGGLSAKKNVGFNAFDGLWNASSGGWRFATNYTPVIPGATYYIHTPTWSSDAVYCDTYDANKNVIDTNFNLGRNSTITMPNGVYFIKLKVWYDKDTTDICINLSWDGEKDGTYEPYVEHTYPLDADVVLRGMFKLDSSNNLYADGDEYTPDGAVNRRYGIVDMGTLDWTLTSGSEHIFQSAVPNFANPTSYGERRNGALCSIYSPDTQVSISESTMTDKRWLRNDAHIFIKDTAYTDAASFKASLSGVYLVYELATPTTEEADPYQQTQICDDFGTEEFISTSPVPVGHNTRYAPNLRAKLEMSPDSPDGDGVYVVQQSNGENAYIPLGSAPTIQNILDRLTALENA